MPNINENTWRQAFGDMPAGFEARIRHTVAQMQSREVPIKRRMLLILAVVLLALAGTALALRGLGLLDTMTENLRAFLMTGAGSLVQQHILQEGGELPDASFTVEEALYDGRQAYILIRVRAKDPSKTLLMDMIAEPAWGLHWWERLDAGEGQPFSGEAYASQRDLLRANIDIDFNRRPSMEITTREIAYDGEDILYTLSVTTDGSEKISPVFSVSTYNVYRDDLAHDRRLFTGTLRCDVPGTDARTVYHADTPAGMPLSGMDITALTLEQTPVATYVTCRYRLKPDAKDRQIANMLDGIWVRWLDENGEPYPDGDSQQGLKVAGEDATELTVAYRAFETIPNIITLEFYNGMTKERLDTIKIPIQKQGGGNP